MAAAGCGGGAAASLASNRSPVSGSDVICENGKFWLPYQSVIGNSGCLISFYPLPSCRGKGTQWLQTWAELQCPRKRRDFVFLVPLLPLAHRAVLWRRCCPQMPQFHCANLFSSCPSSQPVLARGSTSPVLPVPCISTTSLLTVLNLLPGELLELRQKFERKPSARRWIAWKGNQSKWNLPFLPFLL